MDELIKQGQWWWLVLPAVFALFGSWLGTRWGKTTEHQQWLRNERLKVYADFLTSVQGEIWKLKNAGSSQAVRVKFPVAEIAKMDIIGSITVRRAAQSYAQHILTFETLRCALDGEGSILEVPGPDKARVLDKYAEAHRKLIDLGENLIAVVRKDLRTEGQR